VEAGVQGSGLTGRRANTLKKALSLLTKREIFPQFECAQTIFLDFGRRPDQRKRRVRSCSQTARSSAAIVSHPNLNMYRPGSVTRPTCRHVTSLTALAPGPMRYSARAHFEGVELQRERRQAPAFRLVSSSARASSRWSLAGVACGSLRAISMDDTRHTPAGRNRRGYPNHILISFNQLQSTETGVAAFVLATDGACPAPDQSPAIAARSSLPLAELRHEHMACHQEIRSHHGDDAQHRARSRRICPPGNSGFFVQIHRLSYLDILGERQFGPRKHADRHRGLTF